MEFLRPSQDKLEIKGKLSYSEGSQAWSILRFKKELLREFPKLKEKRASISYKMVVYKSYEELEKAIKELEKNRALPIFLFFQSHPQEQQNIKQSNY